ncbi:MAG: TnsA endonuclease N-terminal domain-containing protein [Burkholderiaceae bacterium]|nr:TnsA endonuclease N-terminal domain-containing protein [Burkholderiaceae bacterium]
MSRHAPPSSVLADPDNKHPSASSLYMTAEFFASRQRPPPQTGKMSWPKLNVLIEAGYGQGHRQHYKPWLRVTKHDYSPFGNIGHLPSPGMGHLHHYRSHAERSSLLVLMWLGAHDARDQYPVWPWDHNHLSHGIGDAHKPNKVVGLLKIAAEAGIQHGTFPGTTIPYVATVDIVSTWKKEDGFFFVAHECKPEDKVTVDDPLDRVKERLELTRRYLKSSEIRQHIVHAEQYSLVFLKNLDALQPRLRPELEAALRTSKDYGHLLDACKRWAYDRPADSVLNEFSSRTSRHFQELVAMLHLGIWHQEIDHDLSKKLSLWYPLKKGGIATRNALMQEWKWGVK